MRSIINETSTPLASISKDNDTIMLERHRDPLLSPGVWSSAVYLVDQDCESDSPQAVCEMITKALDHSLDSDEEIDREEEDLRRKDLLNDNMVLFYRELSQLRADDDNADFYDDESQCDDDDDEDNLYKLESSFSDLYSAFHIHLNAE